MSGEKQAKFNPLKVRLARVRQYAAECATINPDMWRPPNGSASAQQGLPVIISMYAEKGGVGKSTATVSLAWTMAAAGKRVLLVDCDGQRSLSKWLLDPVLQTAEWKNTTLTQYIRQGGLTEAQRASLSPPAAGDPTPLYTLRDQLEDSVERAGAVRAAVPFAVPSCKNVWLLAGDSQLHSFERQIVIQEELQKGRGGMTYTGAPYHAILLTAKSVKADVVILDLNPISNTFNRCLVMSSHYLIVPGIADYFTKEMFDELAVILPRWRDEWEGVRGGTSRTFHPLPPHLPKFLGYLMLRFQHRRFGWMHEGIVRDRLALNEDSWLLRVEQAADSLHNVLEPLNLALPRQCYVDTQKTLCLGMIRDFYQLGDLSGHFHVPVNFLRESHMVKLRRNPKNGILEEVPILISFEGDPVSVSIWNEFIDLRLRVKMMWQVFNMIAQNVFSLVQQDVVQLPATPLNVLVTPQIVPVNNVGNAAVEALGLSQVPSGIIWNAFELEEQRLYDVVNAHSLHVRPDWLTRGPDGTDASCLFLSIVDQEQLHAHVDLVLDPSNPRNPTRNLITSCIQRARELRRRVVDLLQNPAHADLLQFVGGPVSQYLSDAGWGDHVCLQALAIVLDCNIRVIRSRGAQIVVSPPQPSAQPRVAYCVGHIYECHYRSIFQPQSLGGWRPRDAVTQAPNPPLPDAVTRKDCERLIRKLRENEWRELPVASSSSTSTSAMSVDTDNHSQIVKEEEAESVRISIRGVKIILSDEDSDEDEETEAASIATRVSKKRKQKGSQ